MKKSILLSICFLTLSFSGIAQTKTTTTTKKPTTVKKAPAKVAPKTTITTKPATTTTPTVAKPVEIQQTVAPPAEVIKEPAGPPVTGAIIEGPKSYSATETKTTTTQKTTTVKTVSKPEKTKKSSSNASEAVSSYIGIRGGYNLSTTQDVLDQLDSELGPSEAEEKFLPGYMGGIVINLGISKVFSIQPEILYSQQGLKVVNGSDKIIGKYDIVNVPLLLKLAFGSPKVKFFINAGPYIGYKLNQSAEISWSGFELNGKQDFVTEYDALTGEKDNRFDFGAIGGAGFQFNIGGPLLVLEGRYQYGMADPTLYKDGKPAEVGNLGHTRVITGTLGLLFPLGGK
ncbi:MAG: porin family protein [Bacteroidota bacterium]